MQSVIYVILLVVEPFNGTELKCVAELNRTEVFDSVGEYGLAFVLAHVADNGATNFYTVVSSL